MVENSVLKTPPEQAHMSTRQQAHQQLLNTSENIGGQGRGQVHPAPWQHKSYNQRRLEYLQSLPHLGETNSTASQQERNADPLHWHHPGHLDRLLQQFQGRDQMGGQQDGNAESPIPPLSPQHPQSQQAHAETAGDGNAN